MCRFEENITIHTVETFSREGTLAATIINKVMIHDFPHSTVVHIELMQYNTGTVVVG